MAFIWISHMVHFSTLNHYFIRVYNQNSILITLSLHNWLYLYIKCKCVCFYTSIVNYVNGVLITLVSIYLVPRHRKITINEPKQIENRKRYQNLNNSNSMRTYKKRANTLGAQNCVIGITMSVIGNSSE